MNDMPRGNKDLVKYQFNSETAKAAAAKSVEVRRKNAAERKALKETLEILMRTSMKKGKVTSTEDIMNLAEAQGKNVTVQTAIALAAVKRATSGDMQAISFIRDQLGEKPSDKVQVDQSITIEEYAKNHTVKL